MSRASRMWIVMALVLLVALVLTGCMQGAREDLLAEPTEDGAGGLSVLPSATTESGSTGAEGVASPAVATVTAEGGVESDGSLADAP
nr:hypothetical protein [Ardenticatenales bacterium]